MERKMTVGIQRHTWLDCSVSWFVTVNGVKTGGELYSEDDALTEAAMLAENIGATFDDDIINTNEMF